MKTSIEQISPELAVQYLLQRIHAIVTLAARKETEA